MRAHLNYDGNVIVKFIKNGIKIGDSEKEINYDIYGRKIIEKYYKLNKWLLIFP